jgi:RNA polymerase sigma-54 factor
MRILPWCVAIREAMGMRIDAGQHMRMEQRMKLSPRMIQSMEILQLPAMALEERIEQELEANPVLDLREPEMDKAQADQAHHDSAREDREGERPLVVGDSPRADAGEEFKRAEDYSQQYGEEWSSNTQESGEFHTPSRPQDSDRDAKMDAMANTAARAASLADQLLDQWRFDEPLAGYTGDLAALRRAGELLIGFIDDDGYLRTGFDQILKQAPREVTLEHLEDALRVIQQRVEPPGIGARDLPECLLLQLDALERDAESEAVPEHLVIARRLIRDHLKDIEQNRLPHIARQSGLTMEQINAGLAALRRLDPRPGRRLAPERPPVVVPDVIVDYDPVNDRYVAALSRGRQPALRINPRYRDLAKDRAQDRATRQYVAQHMNNARWLIDALRQRNNTLLRVVHVVLDAQREFLDHGPQHLKPLPMIQVADQLGIHVGTVSRAVAEKYLQTPRGIYPLRMFFSGGTASAEGDEMSWAAVQAKLKEIVESEDPADPWSDDALVDKLEERGIKIARRTVAKYRQQMNIPPARQRRKFA